MRKIFLFIFLILSVSVLIPPVPVRAECSVEENNNPQNVCFYKSSYADLSKSLTQANQIQIFSGDSVLAEFDESPDPATGKNRFYAGHLGSFWSPPFFSSHESYGSSHPSWQLESFFTSLVFYNRDYHGGAWEEPSDLETEAYWYPSKMVLNKFYPGSGGGTKIEGTKMALSDRRFALKITVTNETPRENNLNLLFAIGMNTFTRLDNWDNHADLGWNWGGETSYQGDDKTKNVRLKYDEANKIIVFQGHAEQSFMAVGLDNAALQNSQWQLSDSIENFAYQFKNEGYLINQNQETSGSGAAAGLSVAIPTMKINENYVVNLLVAVGDSEETVKQQITEMRNIPDIESYADRFWNEKLSNALRNFPVLETTEESLKKIYYFSQLSYLLNRWSNFDSLGEASFYGLSTAFFPWTIGTNYSLILPDREFWKRQILKVLSMDFSKCMAFQPLNHYGAENNLDLCDTNYSYSVYSIVEQIYDYLSITGDMAFLDEKVEDRTILSWLERLTLYYENGDSSNLVDFGNDSKLYEYNIHCDLGGNYTGMVASPNSERYRAMKFAAEIFEKYGEHQKSQEFQLRSQKIKTSINQLWNNDVGWFDTINLYDRNGTTLSAPNRKTFFAVAILHLLDAVDLLSSDQKTKILGKINLFIDFGTLRFTSLPLNIKESWCIRSDWHGPGLYSGEIGQMLTRLFINGQKELASNIMFNLVGKGYRFLAKIPISHQAYRADSESFHPGSQNSGYLEGVFFSQTVIRGLAGINIGLNNIEFAPRMPETLKYPFFLKNIKIQDLIINFSALSSSSMQYEFTPTITRDKIGFGYDPEASGHQLSITINNFLPQSNYEIMVSPKNGVQATKTNSRSDDRGHLQFTITVVNPSNIMISPKNVLSGDLNNDGKVDILDLRQLLANPSTSLGTLIFDYNKIVEGFRR